jgi:hypothetical protein
MARHPKKRTDFGTIVLHWLLVVALLVAALTGLRLASITPGYEWLQAFDAILPGAVTWSWHMLSGVVMVGLGFGYAGYLLSSGLSRRIRLDMARLEGLLGRSSARLGAINIILYWLFFAAMIVMIGSGILLYLGHGGVWAGLHRALTWPILVFPSAHVLVHYAIGGNGQLLRILRPSHLAPPPPPFDPSKVLALPDYYTARQPAAPRLAEPSRRPEPPRRPRPPQGSDDWPRRGGTTLQSNPLVVAVAASFTAVIFLLSADKATRDTLHVPRISRANAPILDGDMADPAWSLASPVTIATQQGANYEGKGVTTVQAWAVHDGETAYFLFTWDDPTRSMKLLPLIKKKDGWYLVQTNFAAEDENVYYDDSFSVALTTTDRASMRYSGGGSFFIGPKPLDDKPGPLSGRGLHYTASEKFDDVWHWKAARGGMLGWCDDAAIGPPAEATPEQVAGRRRYSGGFVADAGQWTTSYNFDQRTRSIGYDRPIQPKRLPKDINRTVRQMGRITPDPNASEGDGAQWWMNEIDTVPYSAAEDARIPTGSLIPGIVASGRPSGDRADVRCAARWGAQRWTLEIARRLNTEGEGDIVINNRTAFRVAAFDHSQIGHTRQIRAIQLELEP